MVFHTMSAAALQQERPFLPPRGCRVSWHTCLPLPSSRPVVLPHPPSQVVAAGVVSCVRQTPAAHDHHAAQPHREVGRGRRVTAEAMSGAGADGGRGCVPHQHTRTHGGHRYVVVCTTSFCAHTRAYIHAHAQAVQLVLALQPLQHQVRQHRAGLRGLRGRAGRQCAGRGGVVCCCLGFE